MANDVLEFTIEAKDQFSGVLSGLAKQFDAIVGPISKAAGVFAGVTGSFIGIAVSAAKLQDDMATLASKTGLTVQSLSALAGAANLADVDIKALEIGIRGLQRNMLESVSGNQEAATAFNKLGVEVIDANGKMKSTEQVMGEAADALNKIEDPATRNATAFKLFGKSASDLMPLLREGSEGMRKLADDATYLGVQISAQAAANAGELDTQMKRLKMSIQGATYAVGNEWIPILTGATKAIANFIADHREAFANFAKIALDAVLKTYVVIELFAKNIGGVLSNLFTVDGFNRFLEGARSAFVRVLEHAQAMVSYLIEIMVESFKAIWTVFSELGKEAFIKFFDYINGTDVARSFGDVLSESLQNVKGNVDNVKQAFSSIGDEAIVSVTEGVTGFGEMFNITSDSINERVSQIKGSFEEMGTVYETTTNAMNNKANEFHESELVRMLNHEEKMIAQRERELEAQIYFAESLTEVWTATVELMTMNIQSFSMMSSQLIMQTFQALSQGIGKSVADAIVFGKNLQESMRSVMKNVIASMIAGLVEWGVQKLIAMALDVSTNKSMASSTMSSSMSSIYLKSFESIAQIPIVGPAMAPGVAAAAVAAAMAGATAAGAAGGTLGGTMATPKYHTGIDFVPNEGFALLDAGERVVSGQQNRDLTQFMEEGGAGGGPIQIENLTITLFDQPIDPIEAMKNMDAATVKDFVIDKVIPALSSATRMGITELSLSRNRGVG